MSFTSIILFAFAIISIGLLLIFLLNSRPPKKKSTVHSRQEHSSPVVPPAPKIYTENAFLLQKIDQRRRIMNEYHYTKITDVHFELVFQLENGEHLLLKCSKTSYMDMPFRKNGVLTHCDGRLIRFKTSEKVISEGYSVQEL